MIGFVGVVLLVVVGIHLYLWKRLVRDTMRPGRWRKLGGVVMVVLAVLVPATLIGSRSGFAPWLAWPGYIWLAVMFYLLVTLIVLEIPRLVVSLVWRARGRAATGREHSAELAGARSGPITSTGHDEPAATDDDGRAPRNAGRRGFGGAVADAASTGGAARTGASTRSTTGTVTGGVNPGGSEPGAVAADSAGSGPGAVAADSGGSGTGAGAADSGAKGTGASGPQDGDRPGIDRRLLLARGAAIFAGLTAAGVTGYGVRTALGGPQLDRVQIRIAKLPRAMDGTRLAVVSDIHLGPLTGANHMSRIVSMINSVDADVVCIVGDMVDGTVEELGRFAEPLRDIRSRQGAYFVTGNHEYYSGFQQWVDEVARLGVRPLRNERLEIRTRGGVFDLAGVNDLGGSAFGDAPDFERALGGRDTARPVVLMAHQPVVARDAARYGVDLQVSGHTHGGQMVPFNLLVKLQQPVVSGYGEVDGVPVYVTNGAGFWGPPVRVGVPPQVTLVELRAP